MGLGGKHIWLVVLIFSLETEDFSLARRTTIGKLPGLPSFDEATGECEDESTTCVHGKCVPNPQSEEYRNGVLVCSCYDGWVGTYCDQRTKDEDGNTDLPPSFEDAVFGDLCNPNPCQARGKCKKSKYDQRGYICICKDYRTGIHCETECQYPYFGEKCDQECIGCTKKVCRMKKGCAKCNLPGYVGTPYCNVTNCLDIPCENFGRCVVTVTGDYGKFGHCKCVNDYVGPRCETYSPGAQKYGQKCVDWENKCTEGSTCVYDATMKPVCICAKGFLGDRCQMKCRSPQECDKGDCSILAKADFREMSGKSKDLEYLEKLENSFLLVCVCHPGYSGKKCNKQCKGYWGKLCANKCGHCQKPPCNPFLGLCPDDKCAKNYYGVRCEKYAKTSSQVEQNMGMRITAINEDDVTYAVNTNNTEAQKLIENLRIFIYDSYDKHGKDIVGVKDILIEEASSEILFVARKSYPASKSDTKLFKTLVKRAPTPDAQDYDVNFTVAFEGESDVEGQTASILRQEANNFNYPGVSIVKNSITAGEKRVVKGTSGLESSNIDGMRGVKGMVSLILMLTIGIALLVLAGWVISGRSQSTSQNKRKKHKQASKGKQKSSGMLKGTGHYKRSESRTRKSKSNHGKSRSSATPVASMT